MTAFSYSVQDLFSINSIEVSYSLDGMMLRHVRYLSAVAEHRNFTRAAEALFISQPTLSQQIQQLEKSLRVQLLDRSGRTVRLTDAGEAYLHYAKLAVRDLEAGERAIHDVKDLSRGSLRLAMTPTFTAYLIGPLLERFNSLHPGIAISVQEMTQDRMEAALSEDDLDLGIAFSGVRSLEIESQPLFVETLSMVRGVAHPRAGRKGAMTADELGQQEMVLLSRDFATRVHIDNYCQEHGIGPHIAIEANSISAIVETVRRGRLATILPEAIAREHDGLESIGIVPEIPSRTASLLRRKGAYRNAASQAFTDLISHWQ